MKKLLITKQIIKNIFIVLILIYFYINTSSNKIFFIPFIICSILVLLRNIFLLFNKSKYIEFFNKFYTIIFFLFWGVFLIYWCYMNIVNKDYILLIYSIPFWLISIYIIKKKFLKINNRKLNINWKIVISGFMVFIVFILGILMLFIGIKDTYKLNQKTKNYITTKGYYNDYEIYISDKDGTTYKLTYIYIVDGIEYEVSTDYGTNYIPDKNSVRDVKYNPDNPSKSMLVGLNNKKVLIYFGAFFVLGSIPFILVGLMMLGLFDKVKIDIIGTYVGFAFLIVGIGIVLIQNAETMSLLETIKTMKLWIFIPIMFIVVGVYQIVNCLVRNKCSKKG